MHDGKFCFVADVPVVVAEWIKRLSGKARDHEATLGYLGMMDFT